MTTLHSAGTIPTSVRTKSDRIAALDPESGDIVALYHPRTQVWQDHFAWTTDGERIVGRTAIGRATVIALQLNRPALVRARTLLGQRRVASTQG